jgi:hypothetical protein
VRGTSTVGATLGDLVAAEADASDAVTLDEHHVGHVDRRLLGDDAAGGAGAPALLDDLGVPLDAVDTLHDHALLLGLDGDDLALAPRSRPAITRTVSPFLMFRFFFAITRPPARAR